MAALAVVRAPRLLSACTGRVPWPQRGVYFFMEEGEVRSDSGIGPRIVRVGTHALKRNSTSTLWTRLSQQRALRHCGGRSGGNDLPSHNCASIFVKMTIEEICNA
jgi:hypothetical protein